MTNKTFNELGFKPGDTVVCVGIENTPYVPRDYVLGKTYTLSLYIMEYDWSLHAVIEGSRGEKWTGVQGQWERSVNLSIEDVL